MKILYFYQYFATPAGSWGTRAYEFARRWVAGGDEVVIVTGIYDKSDLPRGRGLVSRRTIEGIDVRVVNVRFSNKHGLLRRALSFLAYAAVSAWVALTERADVTIASSGPITTAVPSLLARLFRRIPMVLEVRDLWPEVLIQMGVLPTRLSQAVARRCVEFCYRRSSAIVALSPGMKTWILDHYGDYPVHVVTNAADVDIFGPGPSAGRHPLPRDAPPAYALFTGTLGKANGCDQLVAAAAALRGRGRNDIHIVIIGDGSERQRLEAQAKARGLQNIRFLSPVAKHDLAGWVHHASCVLLVLEPIPIFDTSSPNKLFDAMAAGKPVVQTTHGWIRDLLESDHSGLTVPARDPEAFADALETLMDDPAMQARMGGGARAASARYHPDRLAAHFREVLRQTTYGM